MATAARFEQALQRDLDRIGARIREMAALGQQAVADGLRALRERNRQLAYAVIIRDQRIDELEKEVDRLCLEFLAQQQPAASLLRWAYSAIKVNAELERVGDYAESIARHALKLMGLEVALPLDRFEAIGELSVGMLRDAVQAFLDSDAELARQTTAVEPTVDELKSALNKDLVGWFKTNQLPLEALNACMMIARRLERISDQANNICAEALYVATGEPVKHLGADVIRVLFVDRDHGCLSQMAEAIGTAMGRPEFLFSSAGLIARPLDDEAAQFLARKGLAPSRSPTTVDQVPNLEFYHTIVCLGPGVRSQLRLPPFKRVELEWEVPDPTSRNGSPADPQAAYEAAYMALQRHIQDLIQAVLGTEMPSATRQTVAQAL